MEVLRHTINFMRWRKNLPQSSICMDSPCGPERHWEIQVRFAGRTLCWKAGLGEAGTWSNADAASSLQSWDAGSAPTGNAALYLCEPDLYHRRLNLFPWEREQSMLLGKITLWEQVGLIYTIFVTTKYLCPSSSLHTPFSPLLFFAAAGSVCLTQSVGSSNWVAYISDSFWRSSPLRSALLVCVFVIFRSPLV